MVPKTHNREPVRIIEPAEPAINEFAEVVRGMLNALEIVRDLLPERATTYLRPDVERMCDCLNRYDRTAHRLLLQRQKKDSQ